MDTINIINVMDAINIVNVIDDMLCVIPKNAAVVYAAEISHTRIQLLQRPQDRRLNTGKFYAHIHNYGFNDYIDIRFEILRDSDEHETIKALFVLFCNWLVIDRDNNGYTIH